MNRKNEYTIGIAWNVNAKNRFHRDSLFLNKTLMVSIQKHAKRIRKRRSDDVFYFEHFDSV